MRVLVTGGSSGIGAATAAEVAARGWEPVVADIAPPPDGLLLDVTDEQSWESAVAAAWPLDGLVNCAGTRTRSPLHEMSLDVFEEALAIHVRGCFLGLRTLVRGWLRDDVPGRVVNVSSVVATHAVAGQAHYVAAKGAIDALTRATAVEYAPRGLRVNAVAPGTVDTPMTRDRIQDADAAASWLARIPQARAGRPQEVAGAIAFLLSDDATYCNGVVLAVDGGWTAQ